MLIFAFFFLSLFYIFWFYFIPWSWNTCWNHFSPSLMWVPGIKLRPLGLTAALTCWATSPAPLLSFLTCSKLFSVFLFVVYTSKAEDDDSAYHRALVTDRSDHMYKTEHDVWCTIGGRWLMTVVTMNKFTPPFSLLFFFPSGDLIHNHARNTSCALLQDLDSSLEKNEVLLGYGGACL